MGKIPSSDGIYAELLKKAEAPVCSALHHLFLKVWQTKLVPSDWKKSIIVPLYKGKGPKTSCSSYRPVSLLSIPGKVFASILLQRIRPLLLALQRPEQSGFTPARSTVDAILALRILSDIHREFQKPLHVAYVDIKAAFDSVDRLQLWRTLQAKGVPESVLDLVKALHDGTSAQVRIASDLSPPFVTTSGVRQGCVLAPTLFCSSMDYVLTRCEGLLGTTIDNHRFTDLLYADDAALFAKVPTDWPRILHAFKNSASNLGMQPSWAKTKVQNLGYGPSANPVRVGSEEVDAVSSFRYLGCEFDVSGYCSTEIRRRLGMAGSIMGQLASVWRQRRLSLSTKFRIYRSCVLSVLLYGCQTWTVRKSELKILEAFHMQNQRRILGIRWFDFVRNETVSAISKLEPVSSILGALRHSLFGHIRRLPEPVPAHRALQCAVLLEEGHRPDMTWRRGRGRPRLSWIKQVTKAAGLGAQACWDLASNRRAWKSLRPTDGQAL